MTLRQQPFTSPGTWTHPGNPTLAYVEVLLVGGGGSRRTITQVAPLAPYDVGGGGGGIRLEKGVPVTGPVPVTVGAGAPTGATPGGSSSFGPISVNGGAGGALSAPSDGGGAGSLRPSGQYPSPPAVTLTVGGQYGTPSYVTPYAWAGAGGVSTVRFNNYGLGAAGSSSFDPTTSNGYGTNPNRVVANTGAGASIGGTNSTGAPGLVIVRWFE